MLWQTLCLAFTQSVLQQQKRFIQESNSPNCPKTWFRKFLSIKTTHPWKLKTFVSKIQTCYVIYPQEQQDLSFLNLGLIQSFNPSITFRTQAPGLHFTPYHNVTYGSTCAEKFAKGAKNATNASLRKSMYTPKPP